MSPRPRRLAPRELGIAWPDTPIADGPAEMARRLALELTKLIGSRSLREVSRLTGVDRTSVRDILDGAGWPDLATIAKLELGLGGRVWPDITGITEEQTEF